MSDINTTTRAFAPLNGPTASTVSISATVASANVLLPQPPGISNSAADVRAATAFACVNTGSTMMFVAFGGSTIAATAPSGATAGSYPVPPTGSGGPTILSVPGNPTYVAAIMASSTGTLYCTPGAGL